MAILKTLRTAEQCPPSGFHPYIDALDFSYDQWLEFLAGNNRKIGVLPGISPRVVIIGAGASGLCAAYELQRAGCNGTVFEATADICSRCASRSFAAHPNDIAEMGSMRFPPTEFILSFYLNNLGLVPGGLCSPTGAPDFPDPGVDWTYVCYRGAKPQKWKWNKDQTNPPTGFETVA